MESPLSVQLITLEAGCHQHAGNSLLYTIHSSDQPPECNSFRDLGSWHFTLIPLINSFPSDNGTFHAGLDYLLKGYGSDVPVKQHYVG